jgi:hypothetical protein
MHGGATIDGGVQVKRAGFLSLFLAGPLALLSRGRRVAEAPRVEEAPKLVKGDIHAVRKYMAIAIANHEKAKRAEAYK